VTVRNKNRHLTGKLLVCQILVLKFKSTFQVCLQSAV